MKKNSPITGNNIQLSDDDRIISTTDLKGKISYINPIFKDISGFSEEELIGENHNIVRHPEMPTAAFASLWKTVASGKAWMGLVKNRCKNGDHYWVDAYVMPIKKNGVTTEYQSVRLKADDSAISRAESQYKKLLEGEKPESNFFMKVSLRNKLMFMNILALLPLVIAYIFKVSEPVLLLAALATVLIIMLNTYLLTKPIERLTKQAKEIYDDSLMSYIYTGRADDFACIELALKVQDSKINSVVARLHDTTSILNNIASKSSESSEQAHQGALAQHGELAEVASAMVEMIEIVKDVAEHATKASGSTEASLSEAILGKDVVNEAIKSINGLAKEIQHASEVIENLSEHSVNIGDILGVIKGIAEQTNLLALNAAIEAARAGDHGRGFAVVASEVRQLASKTQESALEIEAVIEQLQVKIEQAVGVMGESRNQAENSVTNAEKVGDSLESITSSVSYVNELNQKIATASEAQSVAAHDIDQNIVNISDAADRVSKGAKKNLHSNDHMVKLIHSLDKLIFQFMKKSEA